MKNGFDISYPDIKKVGCDSDTGGAQTKHDFHQGRALLTTSKNIKPVSCTKGKNK